MKAIVYTSQTGHTQRYAQMLAERTGVPAYSLKEAGKSLRRGEEIFYMGWLMAGTVKGLQSAMDRYTIRGAAIVGVSPQGNGDLWTEARINGGYSDSGRQTGRRLKRSATNRMVCGVCAGIAEYFNWDPTIIRIIWVAASIFLGAGFLGVIAYFIVAVIMPER